MYMNYTYITLFESLYLIYMYFFFKTKYNINTALLDKKIQNIGPFFVHNTGANENKICSFGTDGGNCSYSCVDSVTLFREPKCGYIYYFI